MKQFTGDVKAHCVNTVDSVIIPKFKSMSIAPSLNEPEDEHSDRKRSLSDHYLVYGDSGGNLVLIKNREPVFYDQFSFNQVAAIKWLRISLQFAAITSDGVLKLCQFSPIRRQADSNNVYQVVRQASVQTFEELNNQLKFRQIFLRGSSII